jgi:hypothetical protein
MQNIEAEVVVDVPEDQGEYGRWVEDWLIAAQGIAAEIYRLSEVSPDDVQRSKSRLSLASLVFGRPSKSLQASPANMSRALEAAHEGRTVSLTSGLVDEQGASLPRWFVQTQVWRDDVDKRWARFSIVLPEERIYGAAASALQEVLLGPVRSLAARSDPVYGEVGFPAGAHRTVLEYAMRSRGLDETYERSRTWLRGYNWITLVPRQIAEALGGSAALRDTGAFFDVTELEGGAVWLRATELFSAYDTEAAMPVFKAVARALPAGMPKVRPELGVPVKRPPVILEDAVDYGATPSA